MKFQDAWLNASQSFFKGIYKKIEEKAGKANTSVKGFLADTSNRDNISLIIYDILPLAVKLSLRYEKFKNFFNENYDSFVGKMFDIEMKEAENKTEVSEDDEPVVKTKPAAKKTTKAPAKKVTKKKVVKSVEVEDEPVKATRPRKKM